MNLAAFLVFQSHYSTCHLARDFEVYSTWKNAGVLKTPKLQILHHEITKFEVQQNCCLLSGGGEWKGDKFIQCESS